MTRALAIALLAGLVACDDLPAAQNGVCGNKVVDADEDCDTFASETDAFCRPPGAPGQCRYGCGLQADGSTPRCPAGMGCGVDGTCRKPTGTFSEGTQPVAGAFSAILVGDVDGDRRGDVVGVQPVAVTVSYFDGTLALTGTSQTPRGGISYAHPLLHDLSGDGRADLLLAVAGGTLPELGSTDRTLVPTSCPSIATPGLNDARVILLDAYPENPGDELFAVGTINGLSGIGVVSPTGQGSVFNALPEPASAFAGDIVIAGLDEDPALSPCDEFAFAYTGASEVRVYTACKPDGMGGFTYNSGAPPALVALAGGATVVRGPLLVDVNHDGHHDFLVGATSCSGCDEVQVAYGVGDGTFHSDPQTIPASAGDGHFSKYPLVTGPLPLAMGDLNGDGVPDQVTPTAVRVSAIGPGNAVTFTDRALASGEPWTEAIIADLNHDGILDVLGGSSSAAGLDFFNGVGDPAGSLASFQIHTHAPVAHLVVGDFDGDLVNDVALTEAAAAGDPLGDSLSILFGRPVGVPEPPVAVGHFQGIAQVARGRFSYTNQGVPVVYGRDDLVTVSTPTAGETFFGVFRGRGDRVLRSPFSMTSINGNAMIAAASPWRYTLGSFTAAGGPLQVAAIDKQVYPVPATPVNRLWLIPTDGAGGLTSPTARESDPLPPGLDWSLAAIGAVDLDGSGVDQLVALGPSTTGSGPGAFAIARAVAPAGAMPGDPSRVLQIDAPMEIGALVSHAETDVPGAQTGRLVVADMDGDDRPDIVVLATISDGLGEKPSPHVLVLWNDHKGALGAVTIVHNPEGQTAVDFALVDSGGAIPGIALLTGAGVSLAHLDGRDAGKPGPEVIPVKGGRLIAAGDVDGDGVPDLVAADGAGFVVYRGQAVRP